MSSPLCRYFRAHASLARQIRNNISTSVNESESGCSFLHKLLRTTWPHSWPPYLLRWHQELRLRFPLSGPSGRVRPRPCGPGTDLLPRHEPRIIHIRKRGDGIDQYRDEKKPPTWAFIINSASQIMTFHARPPEHSPESGIHSGPPARPQPPATAPSALASSHFIVVTKRPGPSFGGHGLKEPLRNSFTSIEGRRARNARSAPGSSKALSEG